MCYNFFLKSVPTLQIFSRYATAPSPARCLDLREPLPSSTARQLAAHRRCCQFRRAPAYGSSIYLLQPPTPVPAAAALGCSRSIPSPALPGPPTAAHPRLPSRRSSSPRRRQCALLPSRSAGSARHASFPKTAGRRHARPTPCFLASLPWFLQSGVLPPATTHPRSPASDSPAAGEQQS